MIAAAEALELLRDGNRRFVAGEVAATSIASRTHRPGEAVTQNPFAIILACSDSRVPTELIFDRGIGDLFVIRVAGNIVAPSQIGSIEYCAKQFGTKLVVVLGHSNCGAIAATLQEIARVSEHRSPNLRAIVDRIRPVLLPVLNDQHGAADDELVKACITANVRASVKHLRHGSRILEELIESDELTVVGAEYSIETGNIDFLD